MNRSTSFQSTTTQLTVIILLNSRIGDENGELITRTVIDSAVSLRTRDTCRKLTGNLLVGLESLDLCHRREKYRVQRDEHELLATSTYLNPSWWKWTSLRINHLSMSIPPDIRRHCIDPILDRSVDLQWKSIFLHRFRLSLDYSEHWARRIDHLSSRVRVRVHSSWSGAWGLQGNQYWPLNQRQMMLLEWTTDR